MRTRLSNEELDEEISNWQQKKDISGVGYPLVPIPTIGTVALRRLRIDYELSPESITALVCIRLTQPRMIAGFAHETHTITMEVGSTSLVEDKCTRKMDLFEGSPIQVPSLLSSIAAVR
jgi:hypothetical protein